LDSKEITPVNPKEIFSGRTDAESETPTLGQHNMKTQLIGKDPESVRLCATPRTAAYQASPSMGFSRQEHWSGLPFPSPKELSSPVQITMD